MIQILTKEEMVAAVTDPDIEARCRVKGDVEHDFWFLEETVIFEHGPVDWESKWVCYEWGIVEPEDDFAENDRAILEYGRQR